MNRVIERRLAQAEAAVSRRPAGDAVQRGRDALGGLGIDLATLNTAQLGRLEMLIETWPDDMAVEVAALVAVTR